MGQAHHPFQIVLIQPLPGPDLPAIPPGCAKAHAMCFQQDHRKAALCQMQRRRQPGIAAAHHADIRPRLALQRGERCQRGGRGRIIRGRVLPGPVIGEQQVHTFKSRCSRSHGLMTCRNSLYSLRLTES